MDPHIPDDERDRPGERALGEAVLEIKLELQRRFETMGASFGCLDESEQLAIVAAIERAAVEGYNRGLEHMAFECKDKVDEQLALKQLALTIDLKPDIIQGRDVWAEHYDEQENDE
jgi:hypothetical protein